MKVKEDVDLHAAFVEKQRTVFSDYKYLRFPGDGREKEISDLCSCVCPEPTLAKQEFARDSDPNFIIEQFARTQDPMVLMKRPNLQYGDFSDAIDYHCALNRVRAAERDFMELPAQIRNKFDNDAGKLLDFLGDEKNREEAEKLGLIAKAPEKGETPSAGKGSKKGSSPSVKPSKGQDGPSSDMDGGEPSD